MAAVDELSFTVEQGEILGVGGPNGAGKTTLFDVISGLTPASAGSITFDGHDITGKSADRVCHAGISRTFQLNAAYDTLTVEENVLCASYYGFQNVVFPKFRFDRGTRTRAQEAIAFVGLEDDATTVVSELPILQRKLLMLAAAVARRPKLLLLDETRRWPQPAGNRLRDGPLEAISQRTGTDYRAHRACDAIPGGAFGSRANHASRPKNLRRPGQMAWRATRRLSKCTWESGSPNVFASA